MEKYRSKDLPEYSVSIFEDGSVVSEGIKNNNSRKLLSKIDIQSLNLLIDELIDIYFFALDDQYILSSGRNTPLIILSVKWQGKSKKVVYDNNSKVPGKLIGFQKLIEQTVGIHE